MAPSAVGSIRLLSALIVAGSAILTLVACGEVAPSKPTRLIGAQPPVSKSVGDLRLPTTGSDGTSKMRGFAPTRGGLTVVFFGYTYCPDICPTSLAEMRLAIKGLPKGDRNRVTVAFVTVDPARDTPAKLSAYLDNFFTDGPWLALRTTDRRLLKRAERAFGAAHEIGKRDARGDYEVTHTTRTYAVTQDGSVALEWPFGTPGIDIAGDLKILLERKSNQSP